MPTSEVLYSVPEEFNDPNGDITLHSSDQVEFRVSRWPLQYLYPVFSDMFHLPDPTSPGPSTPPVVQMEESASVIEALLRLSYPIDPPIVKDPGTMILVLHAIVKLQAERRCRWWIRMTVKNLVPVNPWAMYAVLLALGRKGCDYNLEEEIRIAARGTVGRPIVRPWGEASLITAADYDRLLMYHSECKDWFLATQEEVWRKAGTCWPWFNSDCSLGRTIRVGKRCVRVTPWFLELRERAKKTLCQELRGEAVEDASLWHSLLEKNREAEKLCSSCARSSALQMPAYAKTLSRLFEEAISQVSSSLWLTETHCVLIPGAQTKLTIKW